MNNLKIIIIIIIIFFIFIIFYLYFQSKKKYINNHFKIIPNFLNKNETKLILKKIKNYEKSGVIIGEKNKDDYDIEYRNSYTAFYGNRKSNIFKILNKKLQKFNLHTDYMEDIQLTKYYKIRTQKRY